MSNQPLFDLRGQHSIRYFLRVGTRVSIKSEEERKCQESIQLVSHLTQNTLWESDKRRKPYRSALRVSSDPGLSPCIPNGPTEETIECRRHERVESTRGVSFHPIVRAPLRPPPPPSPPPSPPPPPPPEI